MLCMILSVLGTMKLYPAQGYPIYQLHNVTVPVQTYFPVKIKATSAFPDKMVMHRFANGKDDYAKAECMKMAGTKPASGSLEIFN